MRARIRERNSIVKTYLLPGSGFDYKANLHCHTTVSDGKFTPEEIRDAVEKDRLEHDDKSK